MILPNPSFYSLAELAKRWSTDAEQIELYARDGLVIVPVETGEGVEVRGVAAEEAARFEADHHQEALRGELREDAERNWQYLAGFLICYVMGDGGKRPAALRDEILEAAPGFGIEFPFSDSWLEKKLKAIRERMAAQGCAQFLTNERETPAPTMEVRND